MFKPCHRCSPQISLSRFRIWRGLLPLLMLSGCKAESEGSPTSGSASASSAEGSDARTSASTATLEVGSEHNGSLESVGSDGAANSSDRGASTSAPATSDASLSSPTASDVPPNVGASSGENTSFDTIAASVSTTFPSSGVDSATDTDTHLSAASTSTHEASSTASESTSSDASSDVVFPSGAPLVMLLIDGGSGVFSWRLPNGNSQGLGEFPDAWEATRATLNLLADETQVRFWPMLYRGERDGVCPNLNPLAEEPVGNNAELAELLPPSSEAFPATKQEGPLADALGAVVEKLAEYAHDGPKHLLVISDGPPGDSCTFFDAPDCNRDPVFGLVQDAFGAGIRTRMLNLGLEEGTAFAEDVSHAGDGEAVVALGQTDYCISMEAVSRGEIAEDDYATQSEYIVNWRQYARAEYLADGEGYAQQLSYSPTDAASLASAVQSYIQWVKAAP